MKVLFFIVPGWSNPGQWRCYPAYRRDNEPIVPGSGHCPGFWILNNPNCTAFQLTTLSRLPMQLDHTMGVNAGIIMHDKKNISLKTCLILLSCLTRMTSRWKASSSAHFFKPCSSVEYARVSKCPCPRS